MFHAVLLSWPQEEQEEQGHDSRGDDEIIQQEDMRLFATFSRLCDLPHYAGHSRCSDLNCVTGAPCGVAHSAPGWGMVFFVKALLSSVSEFERNRTNSRIWPFLDELLRVPSTNQ